MNRGILNIFFLNDNIIVSIDGNLNNLSFDHTKVLKIIICFNRCCKKKKKIRIYISCADNNLPNRTIIYMYVLFLFFCCFKKYKTSNLSAKTFVER